MMSGQACQMAANKVLHLSFSLYSHLPLPSLYISQAHLSCDFGSGSLGEKGHESTAAEHLGTWTHFGPYPPYVESLGSVLFSWLLFKEFP